MDHSVFNVSFKSCVRFHSLSDLAYFTLFRFAEKVNDADKKQLHRTKLTGFKVNLQKTRSQNTN